MFWWEMCLGSPEAPVCAPRKPLCQRVCFCDTKGSFQKCFMADCNQGLRPELLVLLMNQVLKILSHFLHRPGAEIEGRNTVSQMKRLAIWGQLELSSKLFLGKLLTLFPKSLFNSSFPLVFVMF